MSLAYANFDLLVDPLSDTTYRIRVIDSPVGQAQATCTLTPELEAIAAAVAVGLNVERMDAEVARRWGSALYAMLFQGEIETCLRRSLDAAQREGHNLRIRLNLTDAPTLASLPWELAYSPALGRHLALSNRTSLVRYLAFGEAEPRLAVKPPLYLLCVLADPSDLTPRLDVEREWRAIREAVTPLVKAGALQVERLSRSTLAGLRSSLRRNNIHLLHFVGHGWFDAAGNRAGLVLEDEAGQAALVDAETLGVLLEGHRSLHLVFLNACEGARSADRSAFQGTAQYLVRVGIPIVIAMQAAIANERALALAQEFYRSLTDGRPVEAAVTEARKALFDPDHSPEWAMPVLFTRSAEPLLAPQGQKERAAGAPAGAERLALEPETVTIPAGAFWMGDVDAPAEWRRHEVVLPAYAIGKYPVTNQQYAAFAQRFPQHRPRGANWFFTTPPADRLDHPVTGVSWHDAVAYCAWLTQQSGRRYRLPSEAEWEKAARGTDSRTYPWGEAPPTPELCNFAGERTRAVTDSAAGCSPYGVCDLVGNVREWTTTRWGEDARRATFTYPYRPDEREAPSDRANELRVCRGGAYDDPPALLKCSARTIVHSDARLPTVGFRVACDL
ncbi:MAG: SUMF1/EgtB/PvdO family nonheme iron enzyme [Caldilinea sp.]|nr:SUMF1/EgtB/PvdO family nonheme iron enzyme [Caldilinea sp.]MDW8439590.1 SUMF1/EgtB/PvdO family nonheme iron enzyme [Caldilineaceae bacterium]